MARPIDVLNRRPTAFRAPRSLIDALEPRRLLAELIANGNFAANATGWTANGDFRLNAAFTGHRTAPGYAYFAGLEGNSASSNNLVGSFKQSIAIPTGATASLSFWQRITTEQTGAAAVDTLAVRVKNTAGATLATLTTFSNLNGSAASYSQAGPFDLSAYAGQTVSISFDASTNAALGTVFRIDDVSVTSDLAGNAVNAGIPSPTPIGPGVPTNASLPVVQSPVPMFRWNATSAASTYSVLVETTAGVKVFDSDAYFGKQFAGTSFSAPTPLAAGNYRWSVRAYDGTGALTSASPPLYFSVATTGYNRAVGVDISSFQTVVTDGWSQIKNNNTPADVTDDTSFVYAKATEGFTFDDSKFIAHSNGAASAGIPFGAYHYARPGNNSAASEAQHFYGVIQSRLTAGNLRPMLDFEDDSANTLALGKVALSQWLNDFCEAFISLSGIVPVVYTFVSYATSNLDASVVRYPLWQAQYDTSSANPTIPITSDAPSGTSPWPSGGWSMWQYTANRTVAGFTANVDSDVANSSVASFYDAFKIGSALRGSIGGILFNDADNDGVKDAGEAGIAGRSVFLDADGDGVRDPAEAMVTTAANGTYNFGNLLAGTYQVRQIVPGTSVGTGAASQTFQLTPGFQATANFGSRPIDSTPPAVVSSRFNYDAPGQTITLVFSEDVGPTLSAADPILLPVGGGSPIPLTLDYSAATLTATFTPTTPLADGDYEFRLLAGRFADAAGNVNAAIQYDFFELAGDINHDRSVGFDDLLALAQNYGTPSGATFAQGDVTFDGAVGFDDLLVVSQNYNNGLLRAAPPTLIKPATPATSLKARGSRLAELEGVTP